MKKNKIIGITLGAAALLTLAACSGSKSASTKDKTVTIAVVTPQPQDTAIWKVIQSNAKKEYGLTIKFKTFTDYNQPNAAVSSGQVDANSFQHYAFLNAWNKAHKSNIVSIGDTWITPIHLYSDKVKSVKDLKDGATIAVPNDASNESRALYLLEGEGLIKLNVSGDKLATTSNITSNPKKLNIKELDAAQVAHSLASVDAAVINTNYAQTAKIGFDKSIAQEPLNKNSHQWINIIAVDAKNKNEAKLKEVVKALQKPNVKAEIKKQYSDGSELAAWDLKLK